MTTPDLYKHCIEMVEVYQCRFRHDCENCEKMRSFAGNIVYNNILGSETSVLRLAYFRINPGMFGGRIGTMFFLKLEDGHCDKYFKPGVSCASPITSKVGRAEGFFLVILLALTWRDYTG